MVIEAPGRGFSVIDGDTGDNHLTNHLTGYGIRACGSIDEIGKESWDACANPLDEGSQCTFSKSKSAKKTAPQYRAPYDPFVSYAFLSGLEQSHSAIAETGWAPYHLAFSHEDRGVQGVVPMYLKNHSRGEYVFDYGWAEAFERAGGNYYPKLQIAVPFTPVTGRRILSKPSYENHQGETAPTQKEVEHCLLAGITQAAEKLNVSSVHITFVDKTQWEEMGELGFLQRTHNQFHWQNQGYTNFDDFLSCLSSKKRKNIRRERRAALARDIVIERLTGAEITESHWDAFYQFYVNTSNRKWGSPYMTRRFFSLVSESMPDDILLVMCKRDDRYIAGALNFIGGDCLYGRNWGCLEEHPFLHFETCYYQAIEFAIERKLDRVEAGAQGAHKLARGYMPIHTYSSHWIANASFRDAVGEYLVHDRRHVQEEIDYISEHSPFKHSV